MYIVPISERYTRRYPDQEALRVVCTNGGGPQSLMPTSWHAPPRITRKILFMIPKRVLSDIESMSLRYTSLRASTSFTAHGMALGISYPQASTSFTARRLHRLRPPSTSFTVGVYIVYAYLYGFLYESPIWIPNSTSLWKSLRKTSKLRRAAYGGGCALRAEKHGGRDAG